MRRPRIHAWHPLQPGMVDGEDQLDTYDNTSQIHPSRSLDALLVGLSSQDAQLTKTKGLLESSCGARAVRHIAGLPTSPEILWIQDSTLKFWNNQRTGQVPLPYGADVHSLAFGRTGSGNWRIVCGTSENVHVCVYDTQQNSIVQRQRLKGHSKHVRAVGVAGTIIVSGSSDWTVRIWRLTSGKCSPVETLHGHSAGVRAVAVNREGTRAVSGGNDRTVILWERTDDPGLPGSAAWMNRFHLKGHKSSIEALAMNPEGTLAVSGSSDNTARLWDLQNGDCVRVIERSAAIKAVALINGFAVCGTSEGSLSAHHISNGSVLTLAHSGDPVIDLTVAQGLVVSATENRILTWDIDQDPCVMKINSVQRIVSIKISEDGTKLIAGRTDGVVKMHNLVSGQNEHIGAHEGRLNSVVAVDADWNFGHAVSCTERGNAVLWDRSGTKQTSEWQSREVDYVGDIISARFAPKSVVLSCKDGHVRVLDLNSLKESLHISPEGQSLVTCFDVSMDGRRAISGSDNGKLRLLDIEHGKCLLELEGHENSVTSVSLGESSLTAVSASQDGMVKIWDLEAGICTATPLSLESLSVSVAMSADGRTAILKSSDGAVRALDVPSSVLRVLIPGEQPRRGATLRPEPVSISGDGRWAAACGTPLQVFDVMPGLPQQSQAESQEFSTEWVDRRYWVGDLNICVSADFRRKHLKLTWNCNQSENVRREVTFFLPCHGMITHMEMTHLESNELNVKCEYVAYSDGGPQQTLFFQSPVTLLPRRRIPDPFSWDEPRPDVAWRPPTNGPRLGSSMSYLHHLASVTSRGRDLLRYRFPNGRFKAAVETVPGLRSALRTCDSFGRTPLIVYLNSDHTRNEDYHDIMDAYEYDLQQSQAKKDLVSLDMTIYCLVSCFELIRKHHLDHWRVWRIIGKHSHVVIGEFIPSQQKKFWQRSTFLGRFDELPVWWNALNSKMGEHYHGERYKLIRYSPPYLFEQTAIQETMNQFPERAISEPRSCIWENNLKEMPQDLFGTPLFQAATVHRRPIRMLFSSLFLHVLITLILGMLLDTTKRNWNLLGPLLLLGSLSLIEEILDFRADWQRKGILKGLGAYFKSWYNIYDLSFNLSVLATVGLVNEGGEVQSSFLGLALLFCSLKYVGFMRAFPKIAAIVAMVERIMQETYADVILLIILSVGFSACSHAVLSYSQEYSFLYWKMLIRHLLHYTLGDSGIFEYESGSENSGDISNGNFFESDYIFSHTFAFVIFIISNILYVYFVVIIFLNLLIARMGSIYEQVEENQVSSLTRKCALIYEEYKRKINVLKNIWMKCCRRRKGLRNLNKFSQSFYYWLPCKNFEHDGQLEQRSEIRPVLKSLRIVEHINTEQDKLRGNFEDLKCGLSNSIQELKHELKMITAQDLNKSIQELKEEIRKTQTQHAS